jgi:hypothetical protein
VKRGLTILFSGMIAADPHQGGATWAVLQYLLGLRRLGHDVYFVEPVPTKSIRPAGSRLIDSTNAQYFQSVVSRFGLTGHAALLDDDGSTAGLSMNELAAIAGRADVLINISGMLTTPALLEPIATRVYLDLDPAFIQLWHATGTDMRFDAHTHFVTVGRGIGSAACAIPTCGRSWISTAQPVVLQEWPVAPRITFDALTTIGSWRGYGSIEHHGVHYGQKAHSLRRLIELPGLTRQRFVLAMGIHPEEAGDLAALERNHWQLIDPFEIAGTPDDYRRFIQQSKAEFGIAKSGYAVSRCQWFSDRSAAYLASGKPVIAQDTGFGQWLPTGQGLFSFDSMDEVIAAIDAINTNYGRHCEAARELAETYFDSDRVLTRLLQEVGTG